MKQYITLFSDHDDYDSFKEEQNYLTPNVSACIEEEHVHYERDYEREYLTFKVIEPSTFSFSQNNIQYSLDKGKTWTTLTAGQSTPQIGARKTIMWKQTGLVPDSDKGIGSFSSTGKYKAYGNIMSLHYGDDFYGEKDLTEKPYAFRRLFQNDGGVIDASNLILPATTLSESCYRNFFNNSSAGISNLLYAPKIFPAMNLAPNCYHTFFQYCGKLITVPTLPAMVMKTDCYRNLFSECSSLTVTPELPALTLANGCYQGMFQGTAITSAPELPATTLADGCYYNMFYGCVALKTTAVMKATVVGRYSCQGMYNKCSGLTSITPLLASTVAEGCYCYMFQLCPNITEAPELVSTTLAAHCYRYMLDRCSKLNYIKMLAIDISADSCLGRFAYQPAASGVFVQNILNTTLTVGTNGIPSGWTRVYYDTAEDKYYLDTNKTQECDDHGNII